MWAHKKRILLSLSCLRLKGSNNFSVSLAALDLNLARPEDLADVHAVKHVQGISQPNERKGLWMNPYKLSEAKRQQYKTNNHPFVWNLVKTGLPCCTNQWNVSIWGSYKYCGNTVTSNLANNGLQCNLQVLVWRHCFCFGSVLQHSGSEMRVQDFFERCLPSYWVNHIGITALLTITSPTKCNQLELDCLSSDSVSSCTSKLERVWGWIFSKEHCWCN